MRCRVHGDWVESWATTGDRGPRWPWDRISRLRPLRWPETPPAVWYLTIPDDNREYLLISDDVDDVALGTQVAPWSSWYCLPWGPEKRAVSRGGQVFVLVWFKEVLNSPAQQNRTEYALPISTLLCEYSAKVQLPKTVRMVNHLWIIFPDLGVARVQHVDGARFPSGPLDPWRRIGDRRVIP